jgi:mono/diheme cytochrome c family protein
MKSKTVLKAMAITMAASVISLMLAGALRADEAKVKRGEYLVGVAGCNDCHTPGYFLGKPDFSKALSGSEVGFEIPGLGVFHGPNLTPDKDTGLGGWSKQQIITAFTTGQRPDGRELAPAMPWRGYASLTPDDADAIASYLMSIAAVANKVPGPFGADEKPTGFVMRVHPPGQ